MKVFVIAKLVALIVEYSLIVMYGMFDESSDCMLQQCVPAGLDHPNLVAVIVSIRIVDCHVVDI